MLIHLLVYRRRRVKCDETRPTCNRCTKSQQHCEGCVYTPHVPVLQVPAPAVSPGQRDPTGDEMELFYYFRNNVADQIAGEFDRDFWKIYVLQIAQKQPTIWYACNAIAALHREYRCKSNLTKKHQKIPIQTLELYSASIKHLILMTQQQNIDPQDLEHMLIANVLFMILSWLKGDLSKTFTLGANGLNLIRKYKLWERTRLYRSDHQDVLFPVDSICMMYVRADTITIHRRRSLLLSHTPWPESPQLRDNPFVSVTQAYFELEVLWKAAQEITLSISAPPGVCPKEAEAYRESYRMHFRDWERKFYDLHITKRLQRSDKPALLVLEIRVVLLKIILGLTISQLEVSFDKFTSEFESTIVLAEEAYKEKCRLSGTGFGIAKTSRDDKTITITPWLGELLFLVARRCRHPTIRRRAVALLVCDFYRSAAVDTSLYICMAKSIIEIEEKEWNDGVSPCGCISHVFVCNGHRIRSTSVFYPAEGIAELTAITVDNWVHNNPPQKVILKYGLYKGEQFEPEETKPMKDVGRHTIAMSRR